MYIFCPEEIEGKREPVKPSKESLQKKPKMLNVVTFIICIFVLFMAWQHIAIAVSCAVRGVVCVL